jgi:hypothetical protein
MKTTKKQLKEIKEIEKKVANVCDNNDSVVDEITENTKATEDTEPTPTMKPYTSLKDFVALCMSDVDIFLLQDEAQENDKDKLFTVQEIRSQLQNTMIKMTSLDYIHSGIYEVDLFGALSYRLLRDAGFSDKYIKSLDKEVNKK